MNLPIQISSDEKIPLRTRVAVSLVEAIESGRIKSGSAMPSTRELSLYLGISRPTIVRAYEQLALLGYIETQPGGKTYASRKMSPATRVHATKEADFLGPEFLGSIGSRIADSDIRLGAACDLPVLNFGAPPRWAIPVNDWKQLLRRNCASLDPIQYEYSPHPFGHKIVRQVIADYLGRTKALSCRSENLMVFSGSQAPLFYLSQMLLKPGDIVLVEEPGHSGAVNIFSAFGARVIRIPIDESGLVVHKIEDYCGSSVKAVYVTPNYHDPTGVCMTLERREVLCELASRHGFAIIEDAWDSDYSYIRPHEPPLHSLSTRDNVFYIYSFWKLLYPLSMTSCMLLPSALVPAFETAKTLVDGINPVLDHYTLAEFIAEGHLERHLKKTRSQLNQHRMNLIQDLVTAFGQSVLLPKQSAAFWLTVRLAGQIDQSKFVRAGLEHGVSLISTEGFYSSASAAPANEFLISFSSADSRPDFSRILAAARSS